MKAKTLLFISLIMSMAQGIAIVLLPLPFPLYFIYFFSGLLVGYVGVLALESYKEVGR